MFVLLPRRSKSETDTFIPSPAVLARLRDLGPAHVFKVPEDFNDTSSESSHEGSIQIIESNPRTFSVPSHDGESDSLDDDSDVEIASSVQENNGKDSVATTPDHGPAYNAPILVNEEAEDLDKAANQNKVRGLNLQGPSITKVLLKRPAVTGMSQLDPIDLEGDNNAKQDVPDSESDDEGPEILSIQQSPTKTAKSPSWKEHQPESAQGHPFTVADKETDLDNGNRAKRVILETQDHLSSALGKKIERDQSPELALESVAGATDGFDSTDDEGLDHDDGFSDFDHEEDTVDSFSKLMKYTPGPVAPPVSKPQVTFETKKPHVAPVYDMLSIKNPSLQTRSTFRPGGFGVSMSDAVDVSQPTYLDFPPPSMQRAPSPSDAALARHPPGPTSTFNSYPGPGAIYQSSPINCANPQGFAPETSSNAPLPFHHYTHPADQSFHSRPYSQGPFYNRGHDSPSESGVPFTFEDALFESTFAHPSEQVRAAVAPSRCTAANNIDDDARFAAELQAEEDAYATAGRTPARTVQHCALSSESRKVSEGQSSKINISSLVNEPHTENSRPLKRKVDEMSAEIRDEEDNHALLAVEAANIQAIRRVKTHASDVSNVQQETQLPDAQARDVLNPVGDLSLTQDSVLEPIVGSIPTPATARIVEAEGPARKKVKTSATSSRGIGKFVSGVCVGLVGAFATFIATIPASVREEALRELSNAA